MANLYDSILNGSFSQLGMPSGMSGNENLSWLNTYQPGSQPQPFTVGGRGLPATLPASAPATTQPATASAYAPQAPANPAVTAATGMAQPTNVTGKMQPTGGPGYQFGDGLISLLTGGNFKDLATMLSGQGGQPMGGLAALLGGSSAPRPTIAANAMIDGRAGRDNLAGANFMGRSVGTDGMVRAFNNDTRRFEDVSQNRRLSPSQSRRTDSLGDRDMRQTRKPGPGR